MSKWEPGTGRHGKRTSWWLFAAHLVVLFLATLWMVSAFSQGRLWVIIVATAGWVGAFAITAMDDVRIPPLEWVGTQVIRGVDRLTRMGKTRKSEEKDKFKPSGEAE